MAKHRPDWQLPDGVTRGLWEYAHAEHIAADYDDYFAENRMFTFDAQVLARVFPPLPAGRSEVVADLGCGTARALVPLVRRGYRGLAVDLSEQMLDIVADKATEQELPIQPVCANLVDLDCLAEASVDHAISMFSTYGMIRGSHHRQRAFAHVHRILKPGGRFVLHAHNFWFNLYDPGGPWWLLGNLLQSAYSRDVELGDKFFHYRGVPQMFLHVFRLGELKRAVARVGFVVDDVVSLDVRRIKPLPWPWLLNPLRANGWIVVCRKPDSGPSAPVDTPPDYQGDSISPTT